MVVVDGDISFECLGQQGFKTMNNRVTLVEAPRVCLALESRNHVRTKHALPLHLLFAGCRSWLLTLHWHRLIQQPCRTFTLFAGKIPKAGLFERVVGPHSLLRDVTTSCQCGVAHSVFEEPSIGGTGRTAFCYNYRSQAEPLLRSAHIPGDCSPG